MLMKREINNNLRTIIISTNHIELVLQEMDKFYWSKQVSVFWSVYECDNSPKGPKRHLGPPVARHLLPAILEACPKTISLAGARSISRSGFGHS